MLWRVASSNLLLLGSVHVASAPLSLKPAAAAALDEAETIAFEANFEVQVPMPSKHFGSADRLGTNVPADLYEAALALAKRLNVDTEYLSTCRPWWAAFELMNRVLSERRYLPEHGIDLQALRIGKTGGKASFFLESNSAALMAFARAPQVEQEASLAQVAQHTDDGVRMVDSIIGAWESGRPADLEPIYQRALRRMPTAYSAALDERNKQWIRHLLRLAASRRRTVAVVGVLHFAGPNSVQELLSKAGKSCMLIE